MKLVDFVKREINSVIYTMDKKRYPVFFYSDGIEQDSSYSITIVAKVGEAFAVKQGYCCKEYAYIENGRARRLEYGFIKKSFEMANNSPGWSDKLMWLTEDALIEYYGDWELAGDND